MWTRAAAPAPRRGLTYSLHLAKQFRRHGQGQTEKLGPCNVFALVNRDLMPPGMMKTSGARWRVGLSIIAYLNKTCPFPGSESIAGIGKFKSVCPPV